MTGTLLMTLYKIALGTYKRTVGKREGGRGEIGKGGEASHYSQCCNKIHDKINLGEEGPA